MADIFDEVSEDLRAERAQALLKRYGFLLVLLAVLAIAGTGAWKFWAWRRTVADEAVAARFLDASRGAAALPAGAGEAAATRAADAFATVAADAPDGYRTLARLREAGLRDAAGDAPAAMRLWDQVSADTGADPLLRGLSDLLWVQHQVDSGDPAAVEGRLAPLLAAGNPWRSLAQESQAWLLLRTGQADKARAVLATLAAEPAMPDGLRGRVNGLLAHLGGAPPPAASPPAASPPPASPSGPAAGG